MCSRASRGACRPGTSIRNSTNLTFGQRLADRVGAVGGSWSFIIGFAAFLIGWAVLNGVLLANHALDPYPFMFLNLMLSLLAAFQAPIIMMSQNRQAAKDRMAAALDYEVNLTSELAIAELHISSTVCRRPSQPARWWGAWARSSCRRHAPPTRTSASWSTPDRSAISPLP